MLIQNTDTQTTQDWPEDTFIQGGSSGLVFRRDGSTYRTAFVETTAGGTFIRGEGATIAEAELAAWEKYLKARDCDGSGEPHGPFEGWGYQNGAGYCTRCGSWFSKVLPPSAEWAAREQADSEFSAMFADRTVGLFHPRRHAWIEAQVEVILARQESPPRELTNPVEPPTDEERSKREDTSPEAITRALEQLFGSPGTDEKEQS